MSEPHKIVLSTIPSFISLFISFIMLVQVANDYEHEYATVIIIFFLFSAFWVLGNLSQFTWTQNQLNGPHGVFFGIDRRSGKSAVKPVDRDGHILVVGGAGTGKSSSIAIPTLKCFWDATFLAVDIKGELAEKSGRKAHIFESTYFQSIQSSNNRL